MRYRYNVRTGLTRIKTNTRRYVFSGLAVVTMVGAGAALPAAAASNEYCGSSANGCAAAAAAGAQCGTGAGSGAFGVFGPGNNMKGGADGYQTGLNNSAVCGNRP
jgi:hypothetical protein